MHLIFVTGDKGGVCKTTMAAGLADAGARHGMRAILADAESSSSQASATEIAVRSGYAELRKGGSFPAFASWAFGDADAGWMRFLNDISRLGFTEELLLVADSGAAQQNALERALPDLGEATEAGLQTSIVFAAGRSSDSRVAAQALLRVLEGIHEAQRPTAWFVLLDPAGRPESEFHLADAPKGDALTLARALEEDPAHVKKLYLGKLPACFFESLFFQRRTPQAVLNDSGTLFGTRVMLSRWLRTVFDPAVLPILKGRTGQVPTAEAQE